MIGSERRTKSSYNESVKREMEFRSELRTEIEKICERNSKDIEGGFSGRI